MAKKIKHQKPAPPVPAIKPYDDGVSANYIRAGRFAVEQARNKRAEESARLGDILTRPGRFA